MDVSIQIHVVCMIETFSSLNMTPTGKEKQTSDCKECTGSLKNMFFPITLSTHPLNQHLEAWYLPEVFGRISRLVHTC